jgi:phage shock protein A
MTPEEVQELRNLTQEFRTDLANLGANVADIQRRLDALARDVDDIRARLARMPVISVRSSAASAPTCRVSPSSTTAARVRRTTARSSTMSTLRTTFTWA